MKPTNVRWWLMMFIIFPLTFVMSLDRTNMVVSAPFIQKQFGFSLVEMSLILTAFAWTYSFLQVPAGLWIQRIGSRKGLTLANVWWSLLTILTPLGFTVPLFVLFRALLGIGQAADWPASVNAINQWFPKREKARANSILLGGLYLGSVIGTPLTAWIVQKFGWEWSFYSYGLVGIITAWAWYTFFRDRPCDHRLVNNEEQRIITEGLEESITTKTSWAEWKIFFGKSQFWAIGIQYFLLILIQSFYTTWLPTYLIRTRHFSLAKMGITASLPWLSLFIMVFVTGSLADMVYRRTKSRTKARVPFAISGFLISAVFLWLGASTQNTTGMVALLMVSMAGIALTQVSIWSACQDIGGRHTATLTGWVNFCGNFGSVLGPIFTAILVSLTANWAQSLTIMAIAGGLGAILWLFVKPEHPLVNE